MLPYWTEAYGNPASGHSWGRRAEQGLEEARQRIASLLGAQAGEIIFTGSGSESDNLALRGAMMAARAAGRGRHLIVSSVEHKAVLATALQLEAAFGFDLTVVDVDGYGMVDPDAIRRAIRPDTVLMSIMAANNEVGTIQPLAEIGALAREYGVLFHSDAVQLGGYRRWDLAQLPIDLMSLAAHKFGGPKGVGLLYVRQGVPLLPALTGGGQESGLRPGTVNVAFAVGAATALALNQSHLDGHVIHCQSIRYRLIQQILAVVPMVCLLTGHPTQRLPHHASFAFQGLSGNDLLINLDLTGLAASSGSACTTGDPQPSATLLAMGYDESWATGGLRLTVGRQNSLAEADRAARMVVAAAAQLRRFQQATAAGTPPLAS